MRKYNHTEFITMTSRCITGKTSNQKDITESFYMEIYSIMKLVYNISDEYLKGLVLINERNSEEHKDYTDEFFSIFERGIYNTNNQEMVFFMDNIKRDFKHKKEDYENPLDYYLAIYFDALETIIHEFEHVMLTREMKEENDNEAKLLKALHQDVAVVGDEEYNPEERIAELRSFEKILMVLEKMGLKAHPLYSEYENKIGDQLKSGYHYENMNGLIVSSANEGTFVSPAGRYAREKNVSVEDFLNASDGIDDIHDRLYYGLPITEEEYFTYNIISSVRS